MKIIILAAGEGRRMRPLTLKTPKPLLKYRGKANLDHLFGALPKEIDEAIIVVKHLGEQIKKYCGGEFSGRKISYVEGSLEGNAIGLINTKKYFNEGERFAIAYGDEVIATPEKIHDCMEHEFSWLCYKAPNPKIVGVAELDNEEYIKDIEEKPENPKTDIAANGFMIVNTDIFNCTPELHKKKEYFLSDLMKIFAHNHKVKAILSPTQHPQITVPADLKRLNKS
jgi:UDP-N-acetylglucosamine diphosphorylase / glucose-1-phosphate thymidylyltransferase / UDP-N-acetylgalactosamine diphosphorylase / glucosamine-1-phosphate N-acetyltransferase / galactosamine-1-phosphate N-acetyltransferase